MESLKSALSKFFGVAIRRQTYLNALYLLLAFPLGLFYFVFLVTGLSLGLATIIIWVGPLVLALVSGSAAFVGLPFYYQYLHPVVDLSRLSFGAYSFTAIWLIDTRPEALLGCLFGLFLALISLHIFNGRSWYPANLLV